MSLLIRGIFVISLFSNTLWGGTLNDEHFTIVEKNHKKGLFDENGKVIIPVAYEDLGWSYGLPQVFHKVIGYREGSLWGLIGIKNKKVCEPRYLTLVPFEDKLIIAAAHTDEKSKQNPLRTYKYPRRAGIIFSLLFSYQTPYSTYSINY